jgi:hypothetical protein
MLSADQVLCHPMVLIEIACGTPPAPRQRTLSDLRQLRSATVASTDETLALIEREQLQDSGCGAIYPLLLGSVLRLPTPCFGPSTKTSELSLRASISYSAEVRRVPEFGPAERRNGDMNRGRDQRGHPD